MKTNLKQLGSLLTLGLLTLGVRADILFQDNFNSYPPGSFTNGNTVWFAHSGAAPINIIADPTGASGNALQVSQNLAQDVHAAITNASYPAAALSSTGAVAAVYASFSIYMEQLPSSAAYFAHFYQSSSIFAGRVFASTTNGGSGYRIGIGNGSSAPAPILPTDLSLNTSNTVVIRYIPGTGVSTLWLNPANEASPSVTATDAPNIIGVNSIAFRQNTGEGVVDVDNLVVGTAFTNVVADSYGSNPPFIAQAPQDVLTAVTSDNVSFNSLAGGDVPLGYQWYTVTNNVTNGISGATGTSLTLTSAVTNQSGYYYVIVTNSSGNVTSRLAQLVVFPAPVAVVITNQPQSQILNVGDTATFTVVAGGVPPPTYQWFVVTNSGATFKTNIIAGATSSTLTLPNVTTNLSGYSYFVTVSNRVNSTNSAKAVLTVNPVQMLTIAQFRSMVDGSFAPTNTTSVYTVQGTVTTWTNMTTSSASTEFYMQDNTAGIAVFWSGAPKSTNLPPAGAIMKVTGPMAAFNGLIEIEPVFTNTLHKVTVVSTNNPLPTPQPLPFDPNITGNLAAMKAMESTYFVASNVTLAAGTTFGSGVNEPITANASNVLTASMFSLTFTNQPGQTFTLFINAGTDIPGKAKPAGPVTIYGVLGYFTAQGFEFTPSRYADVISYIHATNVLSNVKRYGDLLTNTFTESFLEPGETLTTYVSIGDAGGGTVTLTPITDGLPASAYWDGITSGLNATAVFHFTPTTGDASSNYIVSLGATSTSGSAFTNTFNVYVPTPDEQKICISEFLANPTTNSAWPNFNPLHRSTDTLGISTNDQYIELANLSVNSLGSGWTIDKGNALAPIFDSNAFGNGIASSNAIVIYGGNFTESPGLPAPFASTGGLLLPTSGTGVIILRNQNGYIIDRVVYSSGDLCTNSSLSRFPTANGPFVPQTYISTNYTTAGLQYDGGLWGLPTKVPASVAVAAVAVINNQAVLNFTANTGLASTLWSANNLTDPFKVVFGQQFSTSSGVFSITNLPPTQQFYFITTQ